MKKLLLCLKHISQNLNKTTTKSSNTFKSFNYTHSKSPSIPPKITPNLISPKTLIHHQLHCSSLKPYGVFSKHFSSFSHFKGTLNSFSGSGIRMLRSHFPKFKLSNWSFGPNNAWRSWLQGCSADNIVLGLIVANTTVFVLWRVLDRDFMYRNFTISEDNWESGRLHTLITSAFSHIDPGHFISNMIGLYVFGSKVGRYGGPKGLLLLLLYFIGAFEGSMFYLLFPGNIVNKIFQKQEALGTDPSTVPGLGASGAVTAIMLFHIFLFPKSTILLDFFIPVPAILLGVFLISKDVLRVIEGDPQVSGAVQLGGAMAAASGWLGVKMAQRRFK